MRIWVMAVLMAGAVGCGGAPEAPHEETEKPLMLVVGDSFAYGLKKPDRYVGLNATFGETGRAVYEELSEMYRVVVDYRNEYTVCGVDGGRLTAIAESADCFPFEDADHVIILAGYHDAKFDELDACCRDTRADWVREIWTARAKPGAKFHWVDTCELAKDALANGTAADMIGHASEEVYRSVFEDLGLL